MSESVAVRDITHGEEGKALPASDREALAKLDIAISDTETTGLDRKRNGLTEIASMRAMRTANGLPARLKLFHHFILPLRPEYQDYVAACVQAKERGQPFPDYDRARYEYSIEPQALAVTGTEILREQGLDGPITGLKVNGEKVDAVPFYEVMEEFLAFTRNGERDAYYNAPYDAPFLAKQIADTRAYQLARSESFKQDGFLKSPLLDVNEQRILREYAGRSYDALSASEKDQLIDLMRRFAEVPESYTNPARWRCVMYGYLAAHGMGPENSLNAVSKKLFPEDDGQADQHSGVQDIALAARVALTLPAASQSNVATMAGLYRQILQRVDPAGSVHEGEARAHTNGKKNEAPVHGDVVIQFSDDPEKLGGNAPRYWKFLKAYDEVTEANGRVPQHILKIDEANHTVTINAERANSLMLGFLKKQAFFFQMLGSPLIESVLPFDSTGTVMDVRLRTPYDAANPITGMNYRSLRANVPFLTQHPDKARAYLNLINALHKKDKRVGLVLFKERSDGSLDILIRGHTRAFGDCVLSLPQEVGLEEATPVLCEELATQMKLGAIPNIKEFRRDDDDDADLARDDDIEISSDEVEKTEEDKSKLKSLDTTVRAEKTYQSDTMRLSISPEVFMLMAHRLNTTPEALLKDNITTSHGAITVRYTGDGTKHARYELRGAAPAFHDFVTLDDQGLVGEKPDNIIRDACWLLYRLQRLPGTARLHIEGAMAVLEQPDGVDVEALGLLHRLGIPFKAYDRQIKVDAHQLMKNAFHWSKWLGRHQQERMEEIKNKPLDAHEHKPPRFLKDIQKALWQGKALAVEANEQGECWLLDHTVNSHGQPEHHLLDCRPKQDLHLVFENKRLVVEKSHVQGPQALHIEMNAQGDCIVQASPLLLHLAAYRLRQQEVTASHFTKKDRNDRVYWHVPANDAAKTQEALYAASRFIYGLSKTTGSERQSLINLALLAAEQEVEVVFPKLEFLAKPGIYRELLDVHFGVDSDTQPILGLISNGADTMIRTLESPLTELSERDPRSASLHKMAYDIKNHASTLEKLDGILNKHLFVLEQRNVSGRLKKDLNTLGLLLHEIASAQKHVGSIEDKERAQPDIHTAQEKISNVSFGADELREDLAVARSAIHGLLQEIGRSMASTIDEYAAKVIAEDPAADIVQALNEYRTQTIALLGSEEKFQIYAYQAAMRFLVHIAREQKRGVRQRRIADYLLTQAFPNFSADQKNLLIRLYRYGMSDALGALLQNAFPQVGGRGKSIDAAWLIRQHKVLIKENRRPFDAEQWLTNYPEVTAEIDAIIHEAYQRSGKHYLSMARLCEQDEKEEALHYTDLAKQCFSRAGWADERIDMEIARSRKQRLSAKTKDHIRQQIEEKERPDIKRLDDLLASIAIDGHEADARQKLLEKRYQRYEFEFHAMTDGITDRYNALKQRKALLTDIEKTLKETHDVLMVKYHHVRDLQGLITLLSQQESMVAALEDEDRTKVGEIGAQIRHRPEMVGIHDKTLAQVGTEIDHQQAALRRNFIQSLPKELAATIAKTNSEEPIRVPLKVIEQLFDGELKMAQEETASPVPRSTPLTNTASPQTPASESTANPSVSITDEAMHKALARLSDKPSATGGLSQLEAALNFLRRRRELGDSIAEDRKPSGFVFRKGMWKQSDAQIGSHHDDIIAQQSGFIDETIADPAMVAILYRMSDVQDPRGGLSQLDAAINYLQRRCDLNRSIAEDRATRRDDEWGRIRDAWKERVSAKERAGKRSR
jgi:hypothetical protein